MLGLKNVNSDDGDDGAQGGKMVELGKGWSLVDGMANGGGMEDQMRSQLRQRRQGRYTLADPLESLH